MGELQAVINRGWSLAGVPSTSGGGSVSLELSIEAGSETWLQFGGMIYVEHPVLRPWAGIIDTPWTATAPIKMTAYDPAYMLALRTPDNPLTLSGDVVSIVGQMINLINDQEEMYLRLGDTAGLSSAARTKKIEQKPIWAQLNAFGIETGTEIIVRPLKVDGRLFLYVDLSSRFGSDESFQLFDGDEANMRVVSAKVEGDIRNRVIGIGSQSSATSRLQSAPYVDQDSVSKYRLRSTVQQFRDTPAIGLVQANAQQYLANSAYPKLQLTAEIYETAFSHLDLGNSILVQASKIYLPGGRHGWSGAMRIQAMDFNESRNVITVSMEARL